MMEPAERLDQLLSDRAAAPWVEPSPGLRQRTLDALAATEVARPGRSRIPVWMGAAACFLIGAGLLWLQRTPVSPLATSAGAVGLDPSSMLGSALAKLTSRTEGSLESEARALLADTDRMTRQVIAQLPFTGGS